MRGSLGAASYLRWFSIVVHLSTLGPAAGRCRPAIAAVAAPVSGLSNQVSAAPSRPLPSLATYSYFGLAPSAARRLYCPCARATDDQAWASQCSPTVVGHDAQSRDAATLFENGRPRASCARSGDIFSRQVFYPHSWYFKIRTKYVSTAAIYRYKILTLMVRWSAQIFFKYVRLCVPEATDVSQSM